MYDALAEPQELSQMRENIRRSVDALELCWSCQRICECEEGVVDDGAPVWLCQDCWKKIHTWCSNEPGTLLWPSGSPVEGVS